MDPDLDPQGSAFIWLIGYPGSGSVLEMRIQIQKHGNWLKWSNIPGSTAFQKGFCTFVCMFFFTRIRISMDPHWFVSLDPDLDPRLRYKAGSGSALKPVRIHTLLKTVCYLLSSWFASSCHLNNFFQSFSYSIWSWEEFSLFAHLFYRISICFNVDPSFRS